MLVKLFYVGNYCQGWGREFESPFPLQIQEKPQVKTWGFFISYFALKMLFLLLFVTMANDSQLLMTHIRNVHNVL